ncbi:MAG: CDP-diacylglycerol--glycerol-3-phosphate 3-phosphatidyltransferase [Gemmatimonadales bacterium]|nr:MAG: CDP-diacylglycerol--glycerol-3-phosphate 3-phosphatidyltransferase [Gemmatimonadales bacterium]
MASGSWNLPNAITVARILACPLIFVLTLSSSAGTLFWAFLLFTAAAVSDLWDGYLARKHGLVTTVGKLLDPLADKLLLASTFIPFFIVSQRPDPFTDIPVWGAMPLWVLIVIFGREVAVTLLRSWAARRGSVISAGPSGKIKAFTQNIFCGALLLWYSLVRVAPEREWTGTGLWEAWAAFHGSVVALALAVALILTVYSMGVYLWQNRALAGERDGETP